MIRIHLRLKDVLPTSHLRYAAFLVVLFYNLAALSDMVLTYMFGYSRNPGAWSRLEANHIMVQVAMAHGYVAAAIVNLVLSFFGSLAFLGAMWLNVLTSRFLLNMRRQNDRRIFVDVQWMICGVLAMLVVLRVIGALTWVAQPT